MRLMSKGRKCAPSQSFCSSNNSSKMLVTTLFAQALFCNCIEARREAGVWYRVMIGKMADMDWDIFNYLNKDSVLNFLKKSRDIV